MVDLDELDRLHASLPELEPASWMSHEDDGGTALVIATAMCEDDYVVDATEGLATNAVAILNTWPEVSRELRERRSNATCGDGACRYRPAEVTFDGKTVTVMNSRDAHVLTDMVSELAALRALAEVVKAQCDWAHPGWVPEIREALALVEKAKAP